jgi:hypothetical protein
VLPRRHQSRSLGLTFTGRRGSTCFEAGSVRRVTPNTGHSRTGPGRRTHSLSLERQEAGRDSAYEVEASRRDGPSMQERRCRAPVV